MSSAPQLVEVLRDLTIAWKNRMAYPEGHPACAEALEKAHRKLAAFTAANGPLLMGVAPDGWVVEDAKLDGLGVQPVAEALYQRDVAVVGFEPGLEPGELAALLGLLSKDPRQVSALPMADELLSARLRHVYLEAMDYSRVALEADATAAGPSRRRIYELILGELIAGRQLSADGHELDEDSRRGLDELSRLLAEALPANASPAGPAGEEAGLGEGGAAAGEGPGGGAGDQPAGKQQAAGGRLAELLAAVFSGARGSTSIAKARRLAAVVRAMPETLRRALIDAIVRQLATAEEGGEALAAFTSTLPRQSALASLQRLAQEHVALSEHAVRLARELRATQVEPPSASSPTPESDRLFAELRERYGNTDVDRLNPAIVPEVGAPLALAMPRPRPLEARQTPDLGERRDTLSDDFLSAQLARALLEIVVRRAPAHLPKALLRQLRGHFRALLAHGRLQFACEIVETLRGLAEGPAATSESRLLLQHSLERMADRRSIAALLDGLHDLADADLTRVQKLVTLLGAVGLRHLLSALGEEADRSRRHFLLRLLTALGPAIAGEVTPMLGDSRWFVVRNAVVLLRAVGDRSSLAAITGCASHADPRVRLEAIKTLFAFDSDLSADLLRGAIGDPDPRLAEAVIALAGAHGLQAAREPLLELLARRDFFGRRRAMRLKAIKVLSNLRDPAVLPRLRRFFRGGWLGVARQERLAAYAALVCYPVDVRQPLVERGLRSRDAELRAICARLQESAVSARLEETHV